MAGFYARYVPPITNGSSSEPADQLASRPSTKRDYSDSNQHTQIARKRQRRDAQDIGVRPDGDGSLQLSLLNRQKASHEASTSSSNAESHLQRSGAEARKNPRADGILAKYSVTKGAARHQRLQSDHNAADQSTSLARSQTEPTREDSRPRLRPEKKKHKPVLENDIQSSNDAEPEADVEAQHQNHEQAPEEKHKSIRRKFEKSKSRNVNLNQLKDGQVNGQTNTDSPHGDNEEIELHGLEPLPQPVQPAKTVEFPTYSTLPAWLAAPLRVPSSTKERFDNLGLEPSTILNLRQNSLLNAFPVQSTLIPLLSNGPSWHDGDVCVSAATGSGKTLAYALPMIEALRGKGTTKLRGLIVVPTRELVAQAREVCEMCAAGSSLKIASALGSKTLRDEQTALVESRMVYNPAQYQKERKQEIDWTKFNLERLLENSGGDDGAAFNYVREYFAKVDILICTPGRLVDHLRSTRGFTLDDVQWLIIDEADRLLNESFQEWIEVVMPALRSEASTRSRREVLGRLRLEVPQRHVQKVILSATMTNDLSKLVSLELRNPKLVVVGDPSTLQNEKRELAENDGPDPVPDANGQFILPPTLTEAAVAIEEEGDKPLYLLQLLESHFPIPGTEKSGDIEAAIAEDDVSSSSPDDTSDSDSDSSRLSSSPPARTSPSAGISAPLSHTTAKPTSTFLIFTRSATSSTRLAHLLSLLSPNLGPHIGTLTKTSRKRTLTRFRQNKLSVLIATDRASRGLDLANLAHVVSYDVPGSVTNYVHRVGRTARAGREGKAWTLVCHREGRWFWKEIGKADAINRTGKVTRVSLELRKGDEGETLRRRYGEALKQLGEDVKGRK